MYILVIMDPIELQQPDKDTTIGFILAAQHQGHQIDYAQLHDLFIQNGQAGVSSQAIELSLSSHPFYELGSVQTRRLCDYDTIWMRKDPPVDRAYLHATHILDLAGADTLVVNSPEGIRYANEKLYALQFPDYIPNTLVTRTFSRFVTNWIVRDRPLSLSPLMGTVVQAYFF